MVSPALQQALDALEAALHATDATRFIAAGSLVTVLYDWLLTLDDEVELVYPAPWSIVKLIHIFIRVSSAAGLGMMNFHLSGFRPALSDTYLVAIMGPLQVLSVAASNFLVMRRVGPLYNNRVAVVYGLHFLFLGSYIATITLAIKSIMPLIPISRFSPTLNICITTRFVRPNGAIFFGPLLLETVVFVLTAYKAFETGRSAAAESNTPLLLRVFFRGNHMSFADLAIETSPDGMVHYAVMLVARVLCILVYFEFPPNLLYIGVLILWTAVATMTTRLIINLRVASRRGHTGLGMSTKKQGLMSLSIQ
ncbi:hypothetical protein PIIN_03732 [Serendipita indica DSM 11827]|uniref:DUF6533 domain-containing protein n=1 Tax=Serendipita indica (strain DSM 11827) TaxID=1109443 RepID=G4TEP9_SERID|nr:hypothetical protein PIIN_03732 [Serendipita indica DSM 11827]